MKLFICAVLAAFVYVASAEDSAADIEANKALIQQLHDVLHDSTKTPEQKKAKVEETLKNLKGELKTKIDTLLADIKNSVAAIQNPQAKEVAAKMEEMFKSGELFGDKDQVKAKTEALLANLTPEAKEELHKLRIDYKNRFETDFQQYKNLKPQ